MGKQKLKLKLVFGTRPGKEHKLLWVLSEKDMRVYIRAENTNIETLIDELDDWVGWHPKWAEFEPVVIGNKRSQDVMERLFKFWEEQRAKGERV